MFPRFGHLERYCLNIMAVLVTSAIVNSNNLADKDRISKIEFFAGGDVNVLGDARALCTRFAASQKHRSKDADQ